MFSVRRSKIHGRGCFAEQTIRAGTEFDAPTYEVTEETWTSIKDEESGLIYEFYCPFRFLNHSDDPIAEVYLTTSGWKVYFLKTARKGQEITIDYGEEWHD